jgi:integrase
MPRQPSVPSYRLHKQSGQAIVTLRDGLGNRRDVLLGEYDSPESHAEYARVIAEWQANRQRLPAAGGTLADLTVNELLLGFWKHVEEHHRHPDGTPTSEVEGYRYSLRPLRELYEHTLVRDFGPLALKAVRQTMIDAGLSRGSINQRVGRIKRCFKWGVAEEMVPPAVYEALRTVPGLQAGRTKARETEPVEPVAVEDVEKTLPHLLPEVADMVRLQLLTGARPGEICLLRACDIDRSAAVWVYTPRKHKTAYRGKKRRILIGPRGQEILSKYLSDADPEAYLLSPRSAVAAKLAVRSAARKTPLHYGNRPGTNRKRKPRRVPGERYTSQTYKKAVARACERAWPPPEPLARLKDETRAEWLERLTPEQHEELKRWRRDHSWHPNQLRHTRGTEIRKLAGLDAARAVLGHTTPVITEVYAELDLTTAEAIMKEIG